MAKKKEQQEEVLNEQNEQASECSKDSDCGEGKVCVRGRCVDDIGSSDT